MMIARLGKIGLRPRIVLGYAESAHAALCARHFRRQGWEVHQIGSGCEARRLALAHHPELAPQVVILDIDLPDESGWLTAAKLLLELPEQKVFLVGPERTLENERFAAFIGAAGFVSRLDGAGALAAEILGSLVPA